MSENNINCEIVKDLLPLYHDNVVSDTTAIAVGEHLNNCEECSKEYDNLCTELTATLSNEEKGVKTLLKSIKHKGLIKGIIIAVLCIAVLTSSFYVLTQVPLKNVSQDNLSVTHVYKYEGIWFVYYNQKNAVHTDIEEVMSKNENTLDINIKEPLIVWNDDDNDILETGWSTTKEYNTVETLTLNGKVIWTEQENSADEVPEYIKEYMDSSSSDPHGGVTEMIHDKNKILLKYQDGFTKVYDIDGNLISDYDNSVSNSILENY